LDYRIGPDDHFAPIDARLLRASEFEARAAASLNRLAATVQEGRSGRSQPLGKPCTVPGVIVTALVLELVDGEELAQRIARGPIPLGEGLPIAK
jgi:hypothetical protein